MSKIPRLPGDGAQMTDDMGDLPHSLRASAASILSNLRKKQQAMLSVGIGIDRTAGGSFGGGGGSGRLGGSRSLAKQTPRRVQSVRIVEAKSGYGPKRRTESCSIFGNNFGKPFALSFPLVTLAHKLVKLIANWRQLERYLIRMGESESGLCCWREHIWSIGRQKQKGKDIGYIEHLPE